MPDFTDMDLLGIPPIRPVRLTAYLMYPFMIQFTHGCIAEVTYRYYKTRETVENDIKSIKQLCRIV